MNQMIQASMSREAVTMSSLEIAELTGKAHKNVLADIRSMLAELEIDWADYSAQYADSTGRSLPCFNLDRDLTDTLLAGYSAKMRLVIIRRWKELESRNLVTLPDFTNPAIAARAWADQLEATQAAKDQLALAAPKAAFVDQYVEAGGSMSFRQVAKLLSANERQLRQFLLDNHVMYYLGGVLTPYQPHIEAGRFEVKTGTCEHNSHAFSQSRFTAKGVQWISGQWAQFSMQGAA